MTLLVERHRRLRAGGAGEARPAALDVGVERELADYQQLGPGVGRGDVHLARLVLEDAQAAYAVGDLDGLGLGVVRADAEQDQKALAYAPATLAPRW